MTVSKTNSDAILVRYRHYPGHIPSLSRAYAVTIFEEVITEVNVKKWAAGLLEVRQPCQPKNDTYETLCVISNQTLNICREQVHHV